MIESVFAIYCFFLIQEDILPIPIKFELTPIVNLFTVDNMDERYNITSKEILNWFLPLYLKYCKVTILIEIVSKVDSQSKGFNRVSILDENGVKFMTGTCT